MIKSCPYCASEDSVKVLIRGKNDFNNKINFECTSHNAQNIEQWKPTLYKRRHCDLVFSEFIGTNFSENYTKVVDEAYLDHIEFKKKTFKLFLKKIQNYLNKDINVLEIGSYYGILGNLIKPYVKSYSGLELSSHAADFSRKKFNLNIIEESLEKYLGKDNKFDLIIMTDVIEHLDNPFLVLSLIEKNLNDNGKFIFTTFNFDSLFSKIMGKNYPWIIPMHKYYFSNSTLKNALHRSNLCLFDIKNDVRIIRVKYLLQKLIVMMRRFSFLWKFLLKIDFLKKLSVKIDLHDLKIYFCFKMKSKNYLLFIKK